MVKTAPAPETPTASGSSLNYLQHLAKDAPAGLVVFLVALPLCLGISLASGAPLLSGVITGIVGGVLVSWVSGSQLSVSGPAAGLTAIMLSALATLGTFEAVLAATVVAGVLQLVLGYLKAGIIGMYFPSSVIRGMLAAIGLILILKQIPHFFGADTDYFEDMDFLQFNGQNTFSAIVAATQAISWGSALIGLVSLVVLLIWDSKPVKSNRALRLVPGALIVVVVSILLNLLLKSIAPELQVRPEHLVKLPAIGSFADLTRELRFPDWSALTRSNTYVVAITIAIVASLETLLSVEAVDKLDPHKRHTPQNRELKAQGVGNIVSGLIGGLPLTAVIVRSSANIDAGAQTKVSAFLHGLLLLTSLLVLSSILNLIPLSALAAVLLLIGFKLTKPALYRSQWRLGWEQFLPFFITVVAILFTDLLKGVCVGLAIGIFYILKANLNSAYYFHNEPSDQPNVIHVKLSEHVSFLNKASIVTTFEKFAPGSHVIIDGTDSAVIDYDVLEAIENFRITAPERGIELELRGIRHVDALSH
ncbi:Sulfate permease, MFS superfamily [Hymenobacter daecheongensis DSM 21074]|uniref:Sulfate permease, MFS superfamily n=1 Tax=Hymenobacter daecheongensis DSM 21074 TaxID=1121955 RepID=A0A1M6KII3_9BACT|nr:SulP family inorganic anion transporter [Hymenobacter daecheongensis]SHJ58777.1 Sulfate permease, MFS superfamily [Hymenobacter daecheongensis DSM 21074]